jgi:uncharacterized protein (TIGR00106 family)
MEVKIIPVGTQTPSVSDHIADALKPVRGSDLHFEITPMGTIMEDDSIEDLFDMAAKMHKATLTHTQRVITFIEIDERTDKRSTMTEKVETAKGRLALGE